MDKNNEVNSLGGFNVIIDAVSMNDSSSDDKRFINVVDNEESLSDEELENIKKSSYRPSIENLKKNSNNTSKEEEEEEEDNESNNESDADDNADDGKSKRSRNASKSATGSDGGNATRKSSSKSESTDDDSTDDDAESADDADADENDGQVEAFFDAISEQLGWEIEEDEERPKTVEELIQYFQDVIEENSVPQYANEEVQKIDEFVRNGGDLNKYFSVTPELDLDSINIEDDETAQKRVIKELLHKQGYNDNTVAKKIKKYEDAGILEEEALDAIDTLKEITNKEKEELLKAQKIEHEQMVEQQQRFYTGVVNTIKELKDIRGISIPEKDKKELLDYIFKPDANGVTKYQKDYAKNVKNLIESAYFTMKGDILIDTAKKVGSTSAIKKFKQSLKANPISKGSKRVNNSSSSFDIWSRAAQSL